jgi:hypothetical protein
MHRLRPIIIIMDGAVIGMRTETAKKILVSITNAGSMAGNQGRYQILIDYCITFVVGMILGAVGLFFITVLLMVGSGRHWRK